MSNQTECAHANFFANANIMRLTDREGGPVTGYSVDVTVKCDDCGLPFRFLGLKAGSHPTEPRVSADALELRAPLEPAYLTEICGMQTGEIGHG